MRSLITILVIAVALFPLSAYATIINIPDDYPTIQEGIDHGADGDTVLVQPDTYYENLNFNGHNVVLASLFLMTGDTAYMSSTIIDGRRSRSVITFQSREDSTAQVVGFTIQNGNALRGGGIYCCSSPTIKNNNIINNVAVDLYYGGGGIYCSSSSPTISNNTISGNSADTDGGGIFCYSSSPTISDNSISSNWAGWNGGGIFCYCSSPTISNNMIKGNSARSGGGIYCSWSSPTIRNNTISGNWAGSSGDGGGIRCYCSSPPISNNTISTNSATWGGGISCAYCGPTIDNNAIYDNIAYWGGGIFSLRDSLTISNNTISTNSATWGGGICGWYSSATISNNSITGNSADSIGGGICCYDFSSPTIRNNTISSNSASWGGGIWCYHYSSPMISNNTISGNSATWGGAFGCTDSWPKITNSILWGDTATNGAEIYVRSGRNPRVRYSDVQGGWQGRGNIDAEPIFVGPYNEDFHLRWRSPCINAGDRHSPVDPDGTRNDMGAFYFDQAVAGIVEVYPYEEPIVIPPEGGDISYDGWIFNFCGTVREIDIVTYALVSGTRRYGPLSLYENVRIAGDSLGRDRMSINVPGVAPEGHHLFVAYIGRYPNAIIDSSYFYFTKGPNVGVVTDWTEDALPQHYSLLQNYPNPFNAKTTISYQLPAHVHVKLQVYNLLGQKVATLVDSKQQAGYMTVVWDASQVSSGIYFYRLAAGDFTETRRMMLVK